jgi:hypothetical protein
MVDSPGDDRGEFDRPKPFQKPGQAWYTETSTIGHPQNMGATMNDVQLQHLLKALGQGPAGKRRKTAAPTNGQKPWSVARLPNGEEVSMSPKAAAKLDEMYQRALVGLRNFEAVDLQPTYENLRLQALYPDRYVVWRDTWKGRGKKRILTRTILGHTRTYKALLNLLDKKKLFGEPDVMYLFIVDPDGNTVYY